MSNRGENPSLARCDQQSIRSPHPPTSPFVRQWNRIMAAHRPGLSRNWTPVSSSAITTAKSSPMSNSRTSRGAHRRRSYFPGVCRFYFDLNQITKSPESANHERSPPLGRKRHVRCCGFSSRRCRWTRSNFFLRVVVIGAGRVWWPQFVLNNVTSKGKATPLVCRTNAALLCGLCNYRPIAGCVINARIKFPFIHSLAASFAKRFTFGR
jgi:hypothetical protein